MISSRSASPSSANQLTRYLWMGFRGSASFRRLGIQVLRPTTIIQRQSSHSHLSDVVHPRQCNQLYSVSRIDRRGRRETAPRVHALERITKCFSSSSLRSNQLLSQTKTTRLMIRTVRWCCYCCLFKRVRALFTVFRLRAALRSRMKNMSHSTRHSIEFMPCGARSNHSNDVFA